MVYLYFSFTFKGELVVVKHIKKKELRISRKILIEVKQVSQVCLAFWVAINDRTNNLALVRTIVTPPPNGHLGDREEWPLWRGSRYGEVGGGGGNKTSKVHNICYEYRRQFILTASRVYMEHNQNTNTTITESSSRHTNQILRPFLTFSSVAEKKWPFWQLGTRPLVEVGLKSVT